MTTASDLLQQHIQTLVDDNAQWQTLISDDLLWELVYAPAIGHPARLTGREEVTRHVNWFRGTVQNFRFFGIRVCAFVDPEAAVAEFKAEGLIKPMGEDASQTSDVRFRSFRCLGAVRLSLGQYPSLETRTSTGGY
jgi:hypothetical protein